MKKRVFSHFFHRYPQNSYHFRDQQVIPHRMTYFSSAKYLYQISTPRNGRYRNPAEKRKWNISGHRSDLPPIGNSRTKYWKIDQKTHPRVVPFCQISCHIWDISNSASGRGSSGLVDKEVENWQDVFITRVLHGMREKVFRQKHAAPNL